ATLPASANTVRTGDTRRERRGIEKPLDATERRMDRVEIVPAVRANRQCSGDRRCGESGKRLRRAVVGACARVRVGVTRVFVTIASLRVFTLRGGGGEWRADASRIFRSHEGNKGKKS